MNSPEAPAPQPAASDKTASRRAGWLWLGALLVIAAGVAAVAGSRWNAKSAPQSLAGTLTVMVRPPDRTVEPVPVENSEALPVESGGTMSIDVEFNEPAFIYLVWINPEGEVSPLYPWNNETLEVKDLSQPPPLRRATKRVFSPLLGRTWTFGNRDGVETVVLLARRTALPEGAQIAPLLVSPPLPKLEHPNDLIKARISSQDQKTVASGKAADVRPSDRALMGFLEPLAKHFDFIQAVQFGHGGKKSE